MAKQVLNPYDILGVPSTAPAADIKAAYRDLAKRLHPDLHPGNDENMAKFLAVNNAYQLLSDPEQRHKFDRGDIDGAGRPRRRSSRDDGSSSQASARAASSSSASSESASSDFAAGPSVGGGSNHFGSANSYGPPPGYNAGASFAEDPNVKRSSPGLRADSLRPRRSMAPSASAGPTITTSAAKLRGRDIHISIYISFEEACLGTKKRVTFSNERSAEVTIPPGTVDRARLSVAGAGHGGFGPNSNGDGVVEVRIEPHPYFTRRDLDIHVELPVSITEVVIGGTVKVPTLDGAVTLRIPEGSNTGTSLRLKGKGIHNLKAGQVGDQYVHLKVYVPETINPDLADFVRRWSGARGGDYGLELRRKLGVN